MKAKEGGLRPLKTLSRSVLILSGLVVATAASAYGQIPEAPTIDFPYAGNRTGVWVVAQLHILFAAFILGAPIFAVVSEWLGYKNNDPKYDRLAKEVTKVTVILYSMTALTGGLFIFVLLGTYPDFTTWLIKNFFLVFAVIYPLLFIAETIILYTYFYSWDSMKGSKKGSTYCPGCFVECRGDGHAFCD